MKDIDFEREIVTVRAGKGDKYRTSILPATIKEDLNRHLEKVRTIHQHDLTMGHGAVYTPEALAWKYPNAEKEWVWQYVFPAKKASVDPRSGAVRRHHCMNRHFRKR